MSVFASGVRVQDRVHHRPGHHRPPRPRGRGNSRLLLADGLQEEAQD